MRKWLAVVFILAVAWGLSSPAPGQAPTFTNEVFSPHSEVFTLNPFPGGDATRGLVPGESQALECAAAAPGSGILCSPQFVLAVPAGSTGFTLSVQSGAEFLVFLRFERPVALDQGQAVADLVIQSSQGRVDFALPAFQPGRDFPGLQEGRYFFALAHFETASQRYTARASVSQPRPLPPNTPTTLRCPAFEVICLQQFTVPVDTPTALAVEVRAPGSFIAYLRLNRPVELPELTFDSNGRAQIGNPIADLSTTAQDGEATLRLDLSTEPSLEAGTYYVAVASLENADLELTLSASLGLGAGNQSPQPGFEVTPRQPRAGEPVQFTDTSTDPDGRIVAWRWDFGDGQTETVQNPSHTYSAPGTYRVSLSVTDDTGAERTAVQTLTVLEAEPLSGLFALAFSQLTFAEPARWQRAIQDGCVVYTNVSDQPARVELIAPDGRVHRFEIAPAGAVLVCGNVAHFDR